MNPDSATAYIREMLTECCSPGVGFKKSKFFQTWFGQEQKFFFLFRKNLKITNIQYPELLALLEHNIKQDKLSFIKGRFKFVTSREFKDSLDEIMNCFDFSDIGFIAKSYLSLFYKTIVVDSFYGSCAVYIPPFCSISLADVVARSGYIHSCGHTVFIRRVDKSSKNEFFDELTEYLSRRHGAGSDKLFFCVYAHEHFSRFDTDYEKELEDGLEDTKIYLEKYYMEDERLIDVLKEMRLKFANDIVIPPPGDYRNALKQVKSSGNVSLENSLWLIMDHSVNASSLRERGGEAYYICYSQLWKNDNPLHCFDENKPAWASPTTIPHTLNGAMLNITLPYWPTGEVAIADPFAGSGTTLFEAMKYPNVHIHCSDIDQMSEILIADNIEFYCRDIDHKEIGKIIRPERGDKYSPEYYGVINKVISLVVSNCAEGRLEVTHKLISSIKALSFEERMLFYLYLRAAIKHFPADSEGSSSWEEAVKNESNDLSWQIDVLIKILSMHDSNLEIVGKCTGDFESYSNSCTINYRVAIENMHDRMHCETKNVLDMQEGKFDVVIIDPPYGFNTNEDVVNLANMYSTGIEQIVISLKQEGQLVICLPSKSYTGRKIYPFSKRGFVIQQVLDIVERHGWAVVNRARVVPEQTEIYNPPYYWESKKALKRDILHFTITK